MGLLLHTNTKHLNGKIKITGSKSESNRLLILQGFQSSLQIENLSNSDDTAVLKHALNSNGDVIDIHHAGTAMRFLTAYYACQAKREVVLTGSQRMKERPIHPLVEALTSLGAQIEYIEKEGFPPLKIVGQKILKNEVSISAHISSQYISALMLIGNSLENGLTIYLKGKATSLPYLHMTAGLLGKVGVKTQFKNQSIQIKSSRIQPKTIAVESDWSSASYFYSLVALSTSATIELSTYHQESLQGDSSLVEMYRKLGVETKFKNNSILLTKYKSKLHSLELNLNSCPDLAQTIAVTCFGLGLACSLTGLQTLKIKETDRLLALRKLGAEVEVSEDSLRLKASTDIKKNTVIKTYQDHRMAMAFAPLVLKTPIIIEETDVVSKSFPDFWKCLEYLQITTEIHP